MSAPAPHAHGRAPVRRRGHQHHPRLRADRQPAPLNTDSSKQATLSQHTDDVVPSIDSVSDSQQVARRSDDALSQPSLNEHSVDFDDELGFKIRTPGNELQEYTESEDSFSFYGERLDGDGAETIESVVAPEATDEDPETAELAKLRCTSECTEVLAARENRRRRRCADYPGLAFGSSMFSSDTMMKFSIIKNELQNIKNTALKRAESEVAALSRRNQLLEEDLGRSEERLVSATTNLAEAGQAADESERIRKVLENRTNIEDDRVAILEAQLAQAKLVAEESDKKYEEVTNLVFNLLR